MIGRWGWRLHWRDFSNHEPGMPRPEPQHQDFATRFEAEEARENLVRSDDLIVTIAPVPEPRASKAATTRKRGAASALFGPALPLQKRPSV